MTEFAAYAEACLTVALALLVSALAYLVFRGSMYLHVMAAAWAIWRMDCHRLLGSRNCDNAEHEWLATKLATTVASWKRDAARNPPEPRGERPEPPPAPPAAVKGRA